MFSIAYYRDYSIFVANIHIKWIMTMWDGGLLSKKNMQTFTLD